MHAMRTIPQILDVVVQISNVVQSLDKRRLPPSGLIRRRGDERVAPIFNRNDFTPHISTQNSPPSARDI